MIKVSDLIDTAASAFMAYVKSGNKIRYFVMDDTNKVYDLVRVNEHTDECLIWLGFDPSGLFVTVGCDFAIISVGFACARKYFGH